MSGCQESKASQGSVQDVKQPIGTRKRNELTQERVKELFDYDPESGILTRAKDALGHNGCVRAKRGSVVGTLNTSTGYIQTVVDGLHIYTHRVAWIWMTGYSPEHQIDHINRIRTDNRWCNLREVNQSCNNINCIIRSDNTSGVKGVGRFRDSHWRARIHLGEREFHLGIYTDLVDAVAARLAAEQCSSIHIYDETSTAYLYMQNYLQELKCQKD